MVEGDKVAMYWVLTFLRFKLLGQCPSNGRWLLMVVQFQHTRVHMIKIEYTAEPYVKQPYILCCEASILARGVI